MRILHYLFVCVVALSQSSSICWNEEVIARHYVYNFEEKLNPHQIKVNFSGLYYQALQLQNSQALLQYYLHSQDLTPEKELQWLTQGKLVNHWQANWLLGLYWQEQGQLPPAKLWMKRALKTYQFNTKRRHGVEYTELVLQLVDVLQQLKEYQAANKLLSDAIFVDEHVPISIRSEAMFLRAKGLMLDGQLHQAKDLLDTFFARFGVSFMGRAKGLRERLQGLIYDKYQVDKCAVNVQLLASDYFQWRYAHQLLTQWKSDPQLSTLPICFNKIQSFDPKPLACRDKNRVRLSCDLRFMAEQLPLENDVLPVIVHGQLGVANYNNGIVFTNLSKSFEVFVHELFHHFGFLDEYALSSKIGQTICHVTAPTAKGGNLMVVPSSKLDAFKASKLYQRFSTQAHTCDQFDSVAFKLSSQMTIMGYMDQSIPDLYIAIARDKMLHRFDSMSNYQYAYALAYEQFDDHANYRLWLEKSAAQGYREAKSLLVEQ